MSFSAPFASLREIKGFPAKTHLISARAAEKKEMFYGQETAVKYKQFIIMKR